MKTSNFAYVLLEKTANLQSALGTPRTALTKERMRAQSNGDFPAFLSQAPDYSLWPFNSGHVGHIGLTINVWARARVIPTRNTFRLFG